MHYLSKLNEYETFLMVNLIFFVIIADMDNIVFLSGAVFYVFKSPVFLSFNSIILLLFTLS